MCIKEHIVAWLLPLYKLVSGQQLGAVTDSYETAAPIDNSEADVIHAWAIHNTEHVYFSEGVSVCLFVFSAQSFRFCFLFHQSTFVH